MSCDESPGTFRLVNVEALEGALAGRDRLLSIIDRAAEALGGIDLARLDRIAKDLRRRLDWPVTAGDVSAAMLAIASARAILAEAEPEDLEGGG